MGATDPIANPVIFFDGYCNLCNASVQFIIKRDKKKQFRFASLQSEFAKSALPKAFANDADLQSIVLMDQGRIFTRSKAALLIAKQLSGLWPMLYIFILLPSCLSDFVYDWIAKNRYRWFGRKDHCMIPTPELKSLFVD